MVKVRRNSDESRAEIPGLLPRPRGAHGLCLLAGGERDDTPTARRGRRLGRAGGGRRLRAMLHDPPLSGDRACRALRSHRPADRRTVRYDTDFEEEVCDCPLPELQAWIAREYSRSEWFREACWRNAADFRQAVYGCPEFRGAGPDVPLPSRRGALYPTRPRALSHCGPRCRSCDWLLARYT